MKQLNESRHVRSGNGTRLVMGGLMAAAILISAHAGAAQAPAKPATAPAGNVENGKKLYLAKGCWTCHDYEAQGGNGPRLTSTPLPLKAFTDYVRKPRGGMPPYLPRIISEAEMGDLYAYLQAAPKAAPASSIPLLNQ